MVAALAVGVIQCCLEQSVQYAKDRNAFGKPLTGFQALRHKLADIATTVHLSRVVTYDALRRFVTTEGDAVKEVTMAKLATQRTCFDVMDSCLQIHGGAGYMEEYEIERMARDARLGPIGGGTDEIMREIVGRSFGL